MSNAKEEARLIGASLPVDGSLRTECPICGRKTFTVTRTHQGLVWNCYRASCPTAGFTLEAAEYVPADKPKKRKLKPYTETLRNLSRHEVQWLRDEFGISCMYHDIRVADDGRLALAVKDKRGYIGGWMLRDQRQWKTETEWLNEVYYEGPKSQLYMHADMVPLSWHLVNVAEPAYGKLLLVEDQMSAMCAAEEGINAVALLGVHLNADKVRDIGMHQPTEVIIALDEDATEQAFKLARKWGLAFRSTRVVPLERDLKDEDNDDILHILGV